LEAVHEKNEMIIVDDGIYSISSPSLVSSNFSSSPIPYSSPLFLPLRLHLKDLSRIMLLLLLWLWWNGWLLGNKQVLFLPLFIFLLLPGRESLWP